MGLVPAVIELELALRPGLQVYPARLHGAACSMLEPTTVAHTASIKPFAAGPVVGAGDGTAGWRLGWLGDPSPDLRLDTVTFGPTSCPVLRQTVRPLTFGELCRSRPARRAELELLSPLYFSRNGRDYPLPDPVLILRSTITRWNAHAPEAFTIPNELRESLLSTVYLEHGMRGGTIAAPVTSTMDQTGYVGTVPLALTRAATDEVASLFVALLRFAAVAGIGSQTTHGFGATRLIRLGRELMDGAR
jgi:CRISPR-associated endoribonuclease Cas6